MIGEFELAMDDYNRAIKSNPGSAYAYFGRAELYLSSGQHDKALADFGMAINLDPDHKYYRERRAEAHKLIGEETSYK